MGHIFNLGVFQLPASERLTNTYCENNIIQNLFLDLDNKIKTGIRIGGRGQYNSIENIWIQNAAVASTESYRTSFVTEEKYEDEKLVQKFQDVSATVATGEGAIYVDLPINIAYVPSISPSNPSGLAYEADFNKFNNIHIRNCNIGISFNFMNNATIASVFNGNIFNNINIDWFKTAVDFGTVAAMCNSNTFSNFGIQPDKTNNQFVFRRIHGDRNVLSNINTFDWAAALPCIFMYEISGSSRELTIENSNLRATANLIDNPFYIKDSGIGTKLINNNDVNGYTNNILRGVKDFAVFGQNYYNQAENDFLVQNFKTIKFGGGSLQNSSLVFQPHPSGLWNHLGNNYYIAPVNPPAGITVSGVDYPTPLCVITNRDHNGTFQWTKVSDLLSASSWDHIASQNIKMNNFAIVNNPAVPDPANAPGIRLNNNGNVRVGTEAPLTTNTPKLQVDGDFKVKNSLDSSSVLTTYNGRLFIGETPSALLSSFPTTETTTKLIVNGKVRVKDEVWVKPTGLVWADYVFQKEYKLMSLKEVEDYIKSNGHLPNMPSAREIEIEGIAMGEIINKQQEKIEELTLYLIEMKKEISMLKEKLNIN